MLAKLQIDYPDELEADFQQFYGLNLREVGKTFSYAHAGVLAAQLPKESRCVLSENPDMAWGETEALLANIEFNLRAFRWGFTKDGEKGRNKPKPIEMPSKRSEKSKHIHKTDLDLIDKVLGGAPRDGKR